MKLKVNHSPKLMEAYNKYRTSLKNLTVEAIETSPEDIYNVLNYSHESCYLLETLGDLEVEFLLQLYGICFYYPNTVEELASFYKVQPCDIYQYVHYLLHKLYPEKIGFCEPLPKLEKFQISPSPVAKYKYSLR